MKSKQGTEFSNVGMSNLADIVIRPFDKDHRRPKRHLPYLCVRNGRLTLIVKEGEVVPLPAPFRESNTNPRKVIENNFFTN